MSLPSHAELVRTKDLPLSDNIEDRRGGHSGITLADRLRWLDYTSEPDSPLARQAGINDIMQNDPAWLKAAYADLGLKEGAGSANNSRVVEMFAEAGHPEIRQDSVAWCAAAVGAWLARANLKGTGALTARSYLNYGTKLSTTNIPRGAILIFRRGSSSWQGHVCLCVADEGSRLKVIGGNQSDAVTVTYFSKAALIGARWPETATNSRTLQSGGLSFASLGGAEVMDSLAQTQSVAQEFAPYLRVAQYALVALALIAAGYAAYRFIRKRIRPPEPTEIEGGPSIDQDAPKPKRKRKSK